MINTLTSYLKGRDNNFNLIRFIAATLVLVSHSFPLFFGTGEGEPLRWLVGISLGTVAVDLFFISSGFLIANSLFYRKSMGDFVKARILRIYPGLAVSLIISVFVLGLFFTTLTTTAYLTDFNTYQFLFINMILFFGEEVTLPGVFETLPWPNTVNGSLWTLPFEVRAYALLVIVGISLGYLEKKWAVFGSKRFYLVIALLGMGIYLFDYFHTILPISYFGSEYARLFSMFFIGVAFYQYRDEIILSNRLFYTLLLLLLISALDHSSFFVMYNCSLAYLVFYLAYVPKGYIRKFNAYGDYSYGIYIYAFPVQQAVLALNPNISLLSFFLVSLVITFFFAYFSWQLIEKKALKLKNIKLNIFQKNI
jgi:peptidoglycan/LPS O-acetylase OafA/YrhL